MEEEQCKITFDEEGVYEQQKEEIFSMPNAILFEAVIPPIKEPEQSGINITRCTPYVAFKANEGYNLITKAMLINTLKDYIDSELSKDRDLAAASMYLEMASIRKESQDLADLLKGDNNDNTNINS